MFIFHVANQIVTQKKANSSKRSFFYRSQQPKIPSSNHSSHSATQISNPRIPPNTFPHTTHRSPPKTTEPAQLSGKIPQKPTPRTIPNPGTPKRRNKTPHSQKTKKKKKKIANRGLGARWEPQLEKRIMAIARSGGRRGGEIGKRRGSVGNGWGRGGERHLCCNPGLDRGVHKF